METFDQFGRPNWDLYFISLCFLTAQRSLDPVTKHGCVVVGKDKTILSLGYNSPPRGCDDSAIPLTRPEKYAYFSHAEENAIVNAARTGVSLIDSTFYITGYPCHKCVGMMKNAGAARVVHGGVGAAMVTQKDADIIKIMNTKSTITLDAIDDCAGVIDIFKKTMDYYHTKKT